MGNSSKKSTVGRPASENRQGLSHVFGLLRGVDHGKLNLISKTGEVDSQPAGPIVVTTIATIVVFEIKDAWDRNRLR